MAENIIYSDINPDDPFNQPLIENVEAVLASLTNIFSTNINERFFNLDISAKLEPLLFEPLIPDTANRIYSLINTAVSRFEPRAKIVGDRSFVVPDYDNNRYFCVFEFQIYGFLGTHQFKFNIARS